MPRDAAITVRISADELAELDALVADVDLDRSAVIRAGIRAVVADRQLLLSTTARQAAGRGSVPPQRAPKSGRRRRGGKR